MAEIDKNIYVLLYSDMELFNEKPLEKIILVVTFLFECFSMSGAEVDRTS
jgi:hypothetical protein